MKTRVSLCSKAVWLKEYNQRKVLVRQIAKDSLSRVLSVHESVMVYGTASTSLCGTCSAYTMGLRKLIRTRYLQTGAGTADFVRVLLEPSRGFSDFMTTLVLNPLRLQLWHTLT